MDIQSLSFVSDDQLFEAFSNAFADYERTWSRDEFDRLLIRRGYVPELSFGAFTGGKLAGFVINGIGSYNGQQTAYDAGTGTLKEYRGRGLTSRMLQDSLPVLRANGISQYVLEVLQHNHVAVGIYKKAGFTVSRELDYFVNKVDDIVIKSPSLLPRHSIRPIELTDVQQAAAFHDFQPTWQNSFDALSREPSYYKFLGAFSEDELVGYGIIESDTGDIPHMAVQKSYRRKAIGSAIFQALLQYNNCGTIRLINAESTYLPLAAFLRSTGMERKGRQYEMTLKL